MPDDGAAPPPAPVRPELGELADERRRLEQLAADLSARELALVQREAELESRYDRMAVALSKALLQAADDAGVEPPVDELAVARARRGA